MGFLDSFLGRKIRLGPAAMAHLAMRISGHHFLSLYRHMGETFSDQQSADVACELMRAYFSLACLRAGDRIQDSRSLVRFCDAMLTALRNYSEGEGWEMVRAAFADEGTMAYCHELYLQGRPSEEDLLAVRDCSRLLSLDLEKATSFLMLCAYAHVRTMRYLQVGKFSHGFEFIKAWMLNSESFIAAFKETFSKMEPAS